MSLTLIFSSVGQFWVSYKSPTDCPHQTGKERASSGSKALTFLLPNENTGMWEGRHFFLLLIGSLFICQISKYHFTPKSTRECFKFKSHSVDNYLKHQNRAVKQGSWFRLGKDVLESRNASESLWQST